MYKDMRFTINRKFIYLYFFVFKQLALRVYRYW